MYQELVKRFYSNPELPEKNFLFSVLNKLELNYKAHSGVSATFVFFIVCDNVDVQFTVYLRKGKLEIKKYYIDINRDVIVRADIRTFYKVMTGKSKITTEVLKGKMSISNGVLGFARYAKLRSLCAIKSNKINIPREINYIVEPKLYHNLAY
jgi:alkyl sulfatase BDS1-like metallo-beta-lactamase superfamily hydrolase